jgi:hypothetical protein
VACTSTTRRLLRSFPILRQSIRRHYRQTPSRETDHREAGMQTALSQHLEAFEKALRMPAFLLFKDSRSGAISGGILNPKAPPTRKVRQLPRVTSSVLARTLDHASLADGSRSCRSGSSGGLGFDRALHAAAVAQLAQCAVPKFDAGFDAAGGRTQSPSTRMR